MEQDKEHLRILSILHYVLGGITALFSLFPVIHLMFGLALVFAPQSFSPQGSPAPPPVFGWILVGFAALAILIGLSVAGAIVLNGRYLADRKNYTFCIVVAAIECMMAPMGTALGVFTIVVLMRDSVKEMFAATAANSAGGDFTEDSPTRNDF